MKKKVFRERYNEIKTPEVKEEVKVEKATKKDKKKEAK